MFEQITFDTVKAPALTVSELNEYVRRTLAGDPLLQNISLRGEISGFKQHVSGHWYFTLKDERSRIACALFRQHASRVRFTPTDGMRVILRGAPGLYTVSGSYQFYAESMTQDGVGALYQRFEEMKARLTREGLFDAAKKRPLPLLPRIVGIVTSRTGAVVHDIAQVASRRFPGFPLLLRAAQVQGEGAKEDVARAIGELSRVPGVDVIIVGRGGGSLEDLWAFNEEIVVRAVAACPVPVVSAVGHETDVTLCDFAADVRAPTPSAAAELCVPERAALSGAIGELRFALDKAAEGLVAYKAGEVALLRAALLASSPQASLQRALHRLHLAENALRMLTVQAIGEKRAVFRALADKLTALGPAQALARGYSVVLRAGKPVASAACVVRGDELTLLMAGGRVRAIAEAVETEETDVGA